jgi:SAM-dependent methyltransferase
MPQESVGPDALRELREVHEVTARNRESWNKIAPRRHGEPASFFRDGGSTLEPYERELAGDVVGRRVLHLACSHGDEVLSWANLGARAIGVDISDAAIDTARRKAAEAGLDAEFHRADMFGLPAPLTGLDLVSLSWGAICWAPDLGLLAAEIARRLRPGGSVLVADHHPVWEVLSVAGENRLSVTGDYFGRAAARNSPDPAKQPIGARGGDDGDAPEFAAFVWPVSDVVMAFVRSGLRLEAFREGPAPGIYGGLGDAASRLPAYYVVKATKD